jgi:cysteine synthase A
MDSILNLIGNTPIIELKNIQEKYHLKSKIYAKLELTNPTGSVKDRTALNLVKDAIEKNILKDDNILIEATSGNMGISLSFVSKRLGYDVIIVMPDNMSLERRKLVELYGAKLILTDGKLGMQGAIDKVNELKMENDKIISLNQFNNLSNKYAHHVTGKEILNQIPNIDIFINGIGSSGTISGVGEILKQENENIQVIGVEPASSPLITTGVFGPHKIQGIGANFIPSIMNKDVIDEVRTVTDEDAYFYTRELANLESIICGISAGANLKMAIEIAKEQENKNIVIIIPDRGDRYYSMNL